MYVLVHKNRVIVGPRDWNRAMFEGALQKEKITALIPRVPPEVWPYVIDSETYLSTCENVIPDHNPKIECLYGPFFNMENQSKVIQTWGVKMKFMDMIRQELKDLAASERYKKEVSGAQVEIQNTLVSLDTSREGRNIFVQKYSLMADTDVVNWKFPECWLTITRAELGDCISAGAAHIQAAFDWEKDISDQIDAAQTESELDQIVIITPAE
jgi:hypothetical protein